RSNGELALSVVTQSDEHYVQHLSVMLISLFENNRHCTVNAFIMIPNDMQECVLDKIRHSIPQFSRNLHFLKASPRLVSNLKVFGHVTSAAYYRLFMGELLPDDLQKIIYLDPDILVRGRLDELWNFNLGNSIVGAVTDSFVEANSRI